MQETNPGAAPLDWKTQNTWLRLAWIVLGVIAVAMCLLQVALFINHLFSPDINRGAMFEGVSRVLRGLSLYPPPSAEYVAMTHNPLFPLLTATISAILGESAASLRLAAVIGTIGAWVVVFLAVRYETRSAYWGLIAAGLFAGAYLAFDGYTDYGNADSWLLFTCLLGFFILRVKHSVGWTLLAVTLLCVSFWFKQHGALLAIAGVLYVTWELGLRRALPHWLLASVLGVAAYLIVGPLLFGDQFLYFTYRVPSTWSILDANTFRRMLGYFVRHWALLAAVSAYAWWQCIRLRRWPNVWEFSLLFALMVGFLGTLDPGSENNQYLLPGTWLIVVGVSTLFQVLRPVRRTGSAMPEAVRESARNSQRRAWLVIVILVVSFALNLYNPADALIPGQAWEDYRALVEYVRDLGGVVYMPNAVQLPGAVHLPISVPWVQLEDLVRGPRRDISYHPLVRSILHDLDTPTTNTFIISYVPLETDSLLGYLVQDYILIDDLGARFQSLRAVPGRFPRGWPRYVYAFRGNIPAP